MANKPKLRLKPGFKFGRGGKVVKAEPKPAAPKAVANKSDESENVGLYAQLLKHRDLHKNPPKIKFDNGESAEVSADDRNKMLNHFDSLKGPGIKPEKREKIIAHASASHENFKQHLDGTYKEKERHPMSAVREEMIEKLKKAVEEGVLSQDDFDTISTNMEEVEQIDEKELSDKQKKIAAIAGDKNKIDAEDLKALRSGKKPVSEEVESAPKATTTAYTEATRFRGVESAIREVMSKNLNLRQLAKEEEFKRNK